MISSARLTSLKKSIQYPFILNDVNRADDIIQEAFLSLWENREFIQTDKSLESYVFVILRNKCLNYLKRKRLERDNVDLENISISELQYLYQLDFTRKEEKSLEEQLIESLKVRPFENQSFVN